MRIAYDQIPATSQQRYDLNTKVVYELTCIDDAGLVLCADCWIFSPVDQNLMTRVFLEESNLKEQSRNSVAVVSKLMTCWHG
jgi:hypothetical protein